jgi:histidinol-phosphate aminotransferase
MKVKPPYNINALTSRMALQALKNMDKVRETIAAIIQEREWLSARLELLPSVRQVFHSDANFILVRCTDAEALYKFLAGKEIIVRNRTSEPLLQNCLRITVGTRNENEMLIQAIKEFHA